MHVLQGGILKRPLPLPVGRTVSDIEGRLYVYIAMSHQLTRRLVGVGDKDRGRVAIIQQIPTKFYRNKLLSISVVVGVTYVDLT